MNALNRKQFSLLVTAIAAASSAPVLIDCSGNYPTGGDAGSDGGGQDGSSGQDVGGQDVGSDAPTCPAPFGGGTCDVFPPCGCSPTQNCARLFCAPEKCVPNGFKPLGASCTNTADCQHGLVCADGVCDPLCAKASDCGTNYVCFKQQGPCGEGIMSQLGYAACEPHCNPVFPFTTDATHIACGVGQRCDFFSGGTSVCSSPAGSFGKGASCVPGVPHDGIGSRNDCQAGLDCLGPMGGPYTCKQYCRVGFSDCAGTCLSFATKQYDGNTEIGVCP
jgi:hypothetical protein